MCCRSVACRGTLTSTQMGQRSLVADVCSPCNCFSIGMSLLGCPWPSTDREICFLHGVAYAVPVLVARFLTWPQQGQALQELVRLVQVEGLALPQPCVVFVVFLVRRLHLRVVGGATEEELREGEALQANAFGLNGVAGAAPTVLPRPFVRVLGALQSVVGHFNECFSRLQQSALAFLGIGYMESEHRQGTRLLRPQHDARPVTQGLRCRANIMVVAYMRWQVAVEIREHLVRQVLRRVEVILDSLVSFGKSARKLLRNGGKRRPGFCINTKV